MLLPWLTPVLLFIVNLGLIGSGASGVERGNFYSRPTNQTLADLNGVHLLISASTLSGCADSRCHHFRRVVLGLQRRSNRAALQPRRRAAVAAL